MMKLQVGTHFTPKEHPYIPSWNNATWIVLIMLTLSAVLVKVFPAPGQSNANASNEKASSRFLVAHELPELGTAKQVIQSGWGSSTQESNSGLAFRTATGVVFFCLDSEGFVKSITETKETDTNALPAFCK
jgi:hypothetical protein